jgi:hypothetical protein
VNRHHRSRATRHTGAAAFTAPGSGRGFSCRLQVTSKALDRMLRHLLGTLIVVTATIMAMACYGPNRDQRAAADALSRELGVRTQVGYSQDPTRLLVILPDSIFPDTVAFAERAPAIARSAVRSYRRSERLDSVIVETRMTPASSVIFRVGQRAAFDAAMLRSSMRSN